MSGIEIRASKIHGRGVFATQTYKRGDLVGVYEGIVTTRNTRSRFWLLMGEKDGVEWGVQGTNDLRYLNSSRTPNCRIDEALGVYALKRIAPGDELTFEYEFWGR